MAATVDEQPVLPALKPGQLRVLIRGNGVKRSESAKTKWQPRYFHLVEVGAEDPDQEPDLQFRWGVDEDQLQTPRCKSISVSMLTDVEIGAASDNIKWPYPFAADYNTCFKLSTAKRQYNWAAFPSGKASALRAKLSIELLKRNATEGKQPRLGTMRSLTAAAKSGTGRATILKTSGWKKAINAVGDDPKMKDVTDTLIDSLQKKREILEEVGIPRQVSDQWLTETDWTDTGELDKLLDHLWDLEEERNQENAAVVSPTPEDPRTDWVEVRIFVSSTFADMHAEREVLVRKVFPRLRAWAEPRRIRIVECDLRWGVPKGSKNETIFRTCLEEVDRCILANSQCFFLNMLSERYGWAPSGSEVPDSVIEDFGWTPFSSVTTMEILHAAYRNRNPRALFMFRDPSFTSNLKSDHVGSFTWKDELAKVALPKLKDKIRARFPPSQVCEYSCTVSGYDTSTGVEKVVLDGLDGAFSDRVYTFFVNAISNAYGDAIPEPLSATAALSAAHRERMKSLVSGLVGRERDVSQIVGMIVGTPGTPEPSDDARPLYQVRILGDPGVGTTSVAAAVANHLTNMADAPSKPMVIYHDVATGNVPSTSPESKEGGTPADDLLARRLVAELQGDAHVPDSDVRVEDVRRALEKKAEEVAPRKIVLIIDGDDSFKLDSWEIPGVVIVRVQHTSQQRPSKTKQDSASESEPDGPVSVTVDPLSVDDRKQLAMNILARYNKTLDRDQLDVLAANPASGLPGWLTLACEELRVFGVFETVSDKIAGLADSIEGLLLQVLERVLQEDDDGTLRRLLGCVILSSQGLFDDELRKMLAQRPSSKEADQTAVKPTTSAVESTDASAKDTSDAAHAGVDIAPDAATGADHDSVAPPTSSAAAANNAPDELSYLDWAVAVSKIQPLLWAKVGRYTPRSRAVAKVMSDKLLCNDKGCIDRTPGSLAADCYQRLIDHFMAVSAPWMKSTEGVEWHTIQRVATELAYLGMEVRNVDALTRVRANARMFRELPLGFMRVDLCRQLRCYGMPMTKFKSHHHHSAFPEGPGYCRQCSWERTLSPFYSNDSSCMICGNMVPRAPMHGQSSHGFGERIDAEFCHSHDFEYGGSSARCLVCDNYGISTKAAICHWCSTFGNNRCCYIDLD